MIRRVLESIRESTIEEIESWLRANGWTPQVRENGEPYLRFGPDQRMRFWKGPYEKLTVVVVEDVFANGTQHEFSMAYVTFGGHDEGQASLLDPAAGILSSETSHPLETPRHLRNAVHALVKRYGLRRLS